jgi:hypothetical protein
MKIKLIFFLTFSLLILMLAVLAYFLTESTSAAFGIVALASFYSWVALLHPMFGKAQNMFIFASGAFTLLLAIVSLIITLNTVR